MVAVDGEAAAVVGDGQPPTGEQTAGQGGNQPLGMGEVGEGIEEDDAVISGKGQGLRVAGEESEAWVSEFSPAMRIISGDRSTPVRWRTPRRRQEGKSTPVPQAASKTVTPAVMPAASKMRSITG